MRCPELRSTARALPSGRARRRRRELRPPLRRPASARASGWRPRRTGPAPGLWATSKREPADQVTSDERESHGLHGMLGDVLACALDCLVQDCHGALRLNSEGKATARMQARMYAVTPIALRDLVFISP